VYEIVAPLGAGGMGEVYRARDPRLNRFVALKVLPAGVLDPERRERFQREAQAVAALNHPNIVTLYSIEDDGGTTFLTMELIDGRSLAELLPKQGLPLDRVLKIAIAVADAIAAAHQKGITHRDLKPANIMLGQGEQDGRVKVLDFGLAKLTGAWGSGGDGSTTLPTALATGEGRILGTVAYMSPEQAEGKPVDARSDLFSLGVILYELATGRRPFTGDTSVSVISSIVKDTPSSITTLNPSLPSELSRIVRRALAKDPEDRYQTAKDLRNDLRELQSSIASGEIQLQPAASLHDRASGAKIWRFVAIGLAVVAIGAIALLLRRTGPATPAAPSLQMVRLTSGVNATRPAISPDGKYIAYVQTDDEGLDSIWIRQTATGSAVQIVTSAKDTKILGLTVSPDGAFVDFIRESTDQPLASIWRVPFLGGAARKIVDVATSAPSWSADGRQMAFVTQERDGSTRSIVVADAGGGHARVVSTRKLPLRYATVTLVQRPDLRPLWLPDGRTLIVVGTSEREGGRVQLLRVTIATGAEEPMPLALPTAVIIGAMNMTLSSDGQSLIASMSIDEGGPAQLVRIRLSDGSVTALTSDLNEYFGASRSNDALVTARQEVRSGFWIADAAGNNAQPSGPDVPAAVGAGRFGWLSDHRIFYAASLVGGSGLWATDLETHESQLIVPGAGARSSASADGRTIVFIRNGYELWRADADGSHAGRVGDVVGSWPRITPDGSAVFFQSGQSGLQTPWKIDLASGAAHQFTSIGMTAGAIDVSPDGRFVAVCLRSGAGGSSETNIIPVGGGEPARRLPVAFDASMRWTPDGKGLGYIGGPASANVWVLPIDGGPARALTHFTDRTILGFGWSPDGKRLVVSRGVSESDIVLLKGVR
jgi:Tol biopolymer transport system component